MNRRSAPKRRNTRRRRAAPKRRKPVDLFIPTRKKRGRVTNSLVRAKGGAVVWAGQTTVEVRKDGELVWQGKAGSASSGRRSAHALHMARSLLSEPDMRPCLWCGATLNTPAVNQLFCSTKHRVYGNRRAKKDPQYAAALNRWRVQLHIR